jgi:hypothetical protein
LYYRHSLAAHAALFRDAMDRLYPRPQVRTDAHPLVAITLMRQNGRTLLHLVNMSGHSQTGYYAPVPMRDIHVELAGAFRTARAVRRPGALAVSAGGGYSRITVPVLNDYELVLFE